MRRGFRSHLFQPSRYTIWKIEARRLRMTVMIAVLMKHLLLPGTVYAKLFGDSVF